MRKHLKTMDRVITALLLLAFITVSSTAKLQASGETIQDKTDGLQLIMFEQDGCHYCEIWDANIGGIYNKTPEGKFAPLRKVDIHVDGRVPNVKPVIFTPTFVLYKNGRELGRLTGYISEDFFWGMLSSLLEKHGFNHKIRESDASVVNKRIN